MVQRVSTVAFEGIEVRPVDVQVQVAPGLPAFTIVGLPDKAVSEARERVRSAMVASGLALPARRITINLAPADLPKAAWASPEIEIIAASSLIQLANHFNGTQVLSRPQPKILEAAGPALDLADIKGQESAKRALEVAAAGGHNLLMVGPPGAGKSMLAARLPSILPPLAPAELLEVSMVASVAGVIEGGALTNRRPFRAPHHSASMPALVGGGLHARPGEISLADHGVLFLDELPEFQPQALDSLRQPLETGEVLIARANHRVTYACRRGVSARCAADYQARISGPLIDRIDLHIEVPAVTAADLILPPPTEGSREIADRVALARDRQAARYTAIGLPHIHSNAAVAGAILEDVARPDASGLALLREAADAMRLSARGYHRVLRVARTLADLDGADKVGRVHLAEALSYRALTDEIRRAA
jgi:magnesium chelatase family protein